MTDHDMTDHKHIHDDSHPHDHPHSDHAVNNPTGNSLATNKDSANKNTVSKQALNVHDHDHKDHDDHTHAHDAQDHQHEGEHGHAHGDHDHQHGLWETIAAALHLPGYAHEHASMSEDASIYDNSLATRTVIWSIVILGLATILQIGVFSISGSVALLGDTVHNLGDTLNSLPLLLAFWIARRPPNRRYTYGYGRAEDIAGLIIVGSIAFSAAFTLWESIQKLIHPEPLTNLPWVALAAIIGFIGNEGVAMLEINVGRKIGSEAMVTDGLHARTDGLTSLGVLIAVAGAAVGFPILDPIIGIVLGIMIVFITRNAIIAIWYRLMDAVDPKLVDRAETVIHSHQEVRKIHRLQMRWLGHRLYMETVIALSPDIPTAQSEAITDQISHQLYHEISNLAEVTIAVVPFSADGKQIFWRESAHHRSDNQGELQTKA